MRFGTCPVCFPETAERERRAELAADLAAEEDRRRRAAGLLLCPDHEIHDRCYRARSIAEVRAELRAAGDSPPLGWEQAMATVRRRYAPG